MLQGSSPQSKMTVSSSTAIFGLSLLAIPITYVVNTASTLHGELGLFISGVVALSVMCYCTYLAVGSKNAPTDPLLYAFILGTFASVVDLIIGLENDGLVSGFMTNYLKNGEPYLKTAYGTMICYWDGIGHYAMYLMMLAAYAWNQTYREVGLYWAGSIGHSMIVFIPGNIIGKYGLRWSFLLNVPYMFIPFMGGARFLRERPKSALSSDQVTQHHVSITKRPLDAFFLITLIFFICVGFLRAFAVLGCSHPYFTEYITKYEPYLTDPVAYPKMQMLVYMFYYVPYYIMAVYGLLYPGNSWMPDWSLIHAGAAAQAQVAHIGGSFHYRTPYVHRVPHDPTVNLVFWIINGSLLVLPQLLSWRCNAATEYFTPAKETRNKQS